MTGFLENREELQKAGRLGKLPARLLQLFEGVDAASGISEYLDALAIHLSVQGILLERLLEVRTASIGFEMRLLHGGGRMQLWLHIQPKVSPWDGLDLEPLLGARCLAHAEVELKGVMTRLDVRSAFREIPQGMAWERLSDEERDYYQRGLERTYGLVLAEAEQVGLTEPEAMLSEAYPNLLCNTDGEVVHWADGVPVCVYTPLPAGEAG